MANKWEWLTSDEAAYNRKSILRILARVAALLVAFNFLYLIVQPLDRGWLTLYNHIFPGRLRFVWRSNAQAPVVTELRLSRLIADHIISMPKQPNEYRVVFLGSSDVWGATNRPQDTMPVLINNMGNEAHPQQAAGYRSLNTQFRSKLRGIRPTLD
jgi:hypothetical protein